VVLGCTEIPLLDSEAAAKSALREALKGSQGSYNLSAYFAKREGLRMDTKNWFLMFVFAVISLPFFTSTTLGQTEIKEDKVLKVYSIGKVVKENGRTFIVLDKKYEPGLLGLDKFSSVTVIYWFDRNDTPMKRSILQVHPRVSFRLA